MFDKNHTVFNRITAAVRKYFVDYGAFRVDNNLPADLTEKLEDIHRAEVDQANDVVKLNRKVSE